MSVFLKNSLQTRENNFSPDNILDTCFLVLDKILEHTEKTKKKISSNFDHRHKDSFQIKQDQDQDLEDDSLSLASTSTSSDSSSEDESCCILDKYSIDDFILICYKSLEFDEHLLILAMMYLDKLLAKGFVLTNENIHKTFFVCMMEAQKFYNDGTYSNKDFAKLCGISSQELIDLEFEFLDYIEYNMNIPDEQYFIYKKNLKKFFDSNIIIERKYL